jgi:hypothetical protein
MIFINEKDRVTMGIQCPECSGVRVDCSDCGPSPRKYLCEECGCQWDLHYYGDTFRYDLEKLWGPRIILITDECNRSTAPLLGYVVTPTAAWANRRFIGTL